MNAGEWMSLALWIGSKKHEPMKTSCVQETIHAGVGLFPSSCVRKNERKVLLNEHNHCYNTRWTCITVAAIKHMFKKPFKDRLKKIL